jgi:3-hydroxyisobutyrate dehydrogenase
MQVAVLGTGAMGAGMTRSLLRAGHTVRVWNRTAERAEPLAADGATVAGSAGEAVRGAEVVLVVLFDTAAVLDVLADAAGAAEPGAVWLQVSTIGPQGTERVAALAAEHGLRLVDAPVLGTKAPAEQGKLVALLSGDRASVEAAGPVLAAISARQVHAGERLGAASALKLVCNSWIAMQNAAIGQAIALAEGLGLDPELFLEATKGSAADSAYLHLKAELVRKGDYPPSFTLDGALKDVELILAAAREIGVTDDVLAGLRAVYRRASDGGHGGEDMAAVYTAFPPGR